MGKLKTHIIYSIYPTVNTWFWCALFHSLYFVSPWVLIWYITHIHQGWFTGTTIQLLIAWVTSPDFWWMWHIASNSTVCSTIHSGKHKAKHQCSTLLWGNPPVTDRFPSQRASIAEVIFLKSWRRHATITNRKRMRTRCTITMTSYWVRWRLKSPASWLFTQHLIPAQIKENIKDPRHWPMCGEFTSDRWIHRTKGQ